MLLNFAGLLFFGLCWGSTVPLSKIAVSAGHHPLGMIVCQLVVSVVVLGGYILVNRLSVLFNRHVIFYYAVIAVLGTLVPNTFGLIATQKLPAGIMALVLATVPMTSLCIALLAKLELFSWRRFSGVLMGVCALALIAIPESSLPDRSMIPWLLVALIAPLCYASEGNYVAAFSPEGTNPVVTLFAASSLGLAILLPIVLIGGWGVPVLVTWDLSLWAIFFAGLGHVMAYTGYLWLLGRTGAVFTSQIAYFVTITGVLGAVVFLKEQYGVTVWIAIAMMMVALALVRPLKPQSHSMARR